MVIKMKNKYNKLPLRYIATTTKFSSSHLGWDGGWHSTQGGNAVPVYASTDGVVVMAQSWGDAGNTIRVRYDSPDKDYSIFTQYKHLSKMLVKVGDKIGRDKQIGNMGNTGSASTGAHLHFDYVVTPYQYNYTQGSADRKKYSKDPLKYCYMFDDQVANAETLPILTKVLGTSNQVKKDTTKNQIEVVGYQLRVRKGAGTNQTILGYVDYGIYDYIEIKEANGYTWYNVGFGWIAGTKEDTKVYPKETEQSKESQINPQIEELQNKIKELDALLLEQKSIIENQNKEIDQLHSKLENYSNLKEYVAYKSDKYFIRLEKGEKIYKD